MTHLWGSIGKSDATAVSGIAAGKLSKYDFY